MAKDGINRSISLPQPSIAGRIGTGLGQGLADQLPKEIERGRLAHGLKNLGDQQGLSPFQQYTALASIPGMTSQVLQGGSELLRQQAYLDAIKNQYQGGQGQKSYVPSPNESKQSVKGEIPTLADPESTIQSYKEYIPPTEQQEREEAAENFQKNPARYQYNFDNALAERKAITARNQEIQKQYQQQEATAVKKEEQIKKALDNEIKKLNLNNLPANTIQNYEEKILNSILSKKEGGEGLTQEQAIKKYSKDLEQANRDNLSLDNLSSWSPRDANRAIDSLQKSFSGRNDSKQLMDKLISNLGVSPIYAAHRAYPISEKSNRVINEFLEDTPKLSLEIPNAVYSRLKDSMGSKDSPLSIAYELERKGYDPRKWLEYLIKNQDDLKGWQTDQLNKGIPYINLEDMWMKAWE